MTPSDSDEDQSILSYDQVKNEGVSRRQYIAVLMSLGAPAIAGCQGGGDGGDGGGGGSGGGDGSGGDGGDGDGSGGDGGDGGGDDGGSTPTEGDGNDGTPMQEVTKGGSLRVSTGTTLSDLNGYTQAAPADMAATSINAEYLFHVDENMDVVGGLVSEAEVSNGGQTWTVNLHEGVMFHPPTSREMVAEDVVWNLDRVRNPKHWSPRAKSWMDGAEWRADGDYTVVIEFPEPQLGVDNYLSGWHRIPIYSPDAIENGRNMGTKPVATGPFKFEEWVSNDHLTLSQFDDYWQDDLPHVDEVVIRPITEGSAKVSALLQGNIDIVRNPPLRQLGRLGNNENIVVDAQDSFAFHTLDINPTKETKKNRGEGFPTTHKEIRVAISEAIDRNAVVEILFGGNATPTQNYFPEGSFWHVDYNPHSMGANPERAQKLIQKAGFDEPTVTLISTASRDDFRRLGRIARDNLMEAGFDVDLQEYPNTEWSDKLWNGQFDISVDNFSGAPDPVALRGFWHYKEENPPFFNYNYEEAELIYQRWDKGIRTADRQNRKQIFDGVQQMIIDDPIRCVLCHPQMIHAYRTEVKGYSTHPWDTIMDVRGTWLDR